MPSIRQRFHLSPCSDFRSHFFIPTVTFIGLQFATLLAGTILIEWVFGWTGIGWLIVNAIHAQDYQVVQGGVLMMAAFFVGVNLAVDVIYAFLDPRIRY